LKALPAVRRVWPSEGNFLLARFADVAAAMAACEAADVLVRDFSQQPQLGGCLRITVGTAAENRKLLAALDRLPAKSGGVVHG